MEYTIHIHPGHLEAVFSGEFELAACQASVDEVFRLCSQHAMSKVLVNGLKLSTDVPVSSRFNLGAYVATRAAQRVRIAIVTSPSVVRKSKALQNTANNRGAQVMTTESMNDALAFLEIST